MDNSADDFEYLTHSLPRKAYAWVDDSIVSNCTKCKKAFGFFLRKHHCRLCGKIFCGYCSEKQIDVPDNILSDDSKRGSWSDYVNTYYNQNTKRKHRSCDDCFILIERIHSIKKLVELFRLLTIDIKQLKILGKVCKLWNNATNYILLNFKETHTKLLTDEYTDYERTTLWTNAKYFSGHSKYMYHLLKISKTEQEFGNALTIIKTHKNISCKTLLCPKNCTKKLTSMDAINILSHSYRQIGNNHLLRSIALNHLECSNVEFKCYISLLVYYLRYDDGLLINYFITRCSQHIKLLNSLYWELNMYPKTAETNDNYNILLEKLKNLFSKKEKEHEFIKILQGQCLVKAIENVSSFVYDKKYNDVKDSFSIKGDVSSPIDPTIKIKELMLEKIKIKDSATRPIIIPCKTIQNKQISFLYKKDNLRNDQLIINILTIVDTIVKREENLDLNIVIYDVLPITEKTGLIEMVENSQTIYHLQEKLKTSIQNYILDNNDNLKIKDVRDKFIKSTAAYCVVSYLLGLGDRHLDNIMITKDGKLFHVDFGYILGRDPLFNNPNIKITPEIIDAIGGLSSVYYKYFTDLCVKIYNCLRRNADIFVSMLLLLPKVTDNAITEEYVIEQVKKRFIPYQPNNIARMHFVNQLEKNDYTEKIKDWCHYHSKEQTINSAKIRLSEAISTFWK